MPHLAIFFPNAGHAGDGFKTVPNGLPHARFQRLFLHEFGSPNGDLPPIDGPSARADVPHMWLVSLSNPFFVQLLIDFVSWELPDWLFNHPFTVGTSVP